MPFFDDQHYNAAAVVQLGGLRLTKPIDAAEARKYEVYSGFYMLGCL